MAQIKRPTHKQNITSFSIIAELTRDCKIEKSAKKLIFGQFWPQFRASRWPVWPPLLIAMNLNSWASVLEIFLSKWGLYTTYSGLQIRFFPKNCHFLHIITNFLFVFFLTEWPKRVILVHIDQLAKMTSELQSLLANTFLGSSPGRRLSSVE